MEFAGSEINHLFASPRREKGKKVSRTNLEFTLAEVYVTLILRKFCI